MLNLLIKLSIQNVLFENKNCFAKFKFYGDIPKDEYMERLKSIEGDNEVLIFFEKINEIVF